ncbi:hypothetical protein LTR36_004275 [Oleoguttula mirabilis]|uniref:Uncharacterized protein n=1 Tax=Oleoguttula mirabilis TaxID=1507867 RepID=A0AAV9JHM5_9PEZI|nr:hypothetical protein LTR36_004275 [Oleoguttula mirabilis]
MCLAIGKLAHDRYQEHQGEKRAIAHGASPAENDSRLSHESLSDQPNSGIQEKAGMMPPSYIELVVSRAIVPPEPHTVTDNKKGWVDVAGEDRLNEHGGPSEEETFYDVSDGTSMPRAQVAAGRPSLVEMWKARKAEKQTARQAECAQWKAERAVRRAGKKARCGGCC